MKFAMAGNTLTRQVENWLGVKQRIVLANNNSLFTNMFMHFNITLSYRILESGTIFTMLQCGYFSQLGSVFVDQR